MPSEPDIINYRESRESQNITSWKGEELLAKNLAALALCEPELTQRLQKIRMPDHVKAAITRDGVVSFRFTQSDGRRPWLGGVSTPRIAAQENVKRVDMGSANAAIAGIGQGSEAAALLTKLYPYQALFVIEKNPMYLYLALQLHDFSTALARGQLVLLCGEDVAALLTEFYQCHPGYSLIKQTVTNPWLTDQENQAFSQQVNRGMEQAMEAIYAAGKAAQARQQEWTPSFSRESLAASIAQKKYETVRVTNAATLPTPLYLAWTRNLLAGFAQLGCRTALFPQDSPASSSHYAQLDHWNRQRPHLVLLTDMLRGDCPDSLPPACAAATWIRELPQERFGADKNAPSRLGRHDMIFTARQEQREKLLERGFASDRVKVLGWSVNTELFGPLAAETLDDRYRCEAVILGERGSSDAETYHITLPTQQALWKKVLEDIAAAPQLYWRGKGGWFLEQAQRIGVTLTDKDVREQFIQLLEGFAIPALLKDVYAAALTQAGIPTALWGWSLPRADQEGQYRKFWEESPVRHCRRGAVNMAEELNACYNGAKIAIHIGDSGLMDQLLLNGIATGTLMLVRRTPDLNGTDGIGRYFELEQELVTFDTPKDMIQKVRYYLSHESERQRLAGKARSKAAVRYSVKEQCRAMLEDVFK